MLNGKAVNFCQILAFAQLHKKASESRTWFGDDMANWLGEPKRRYEQPLQSMVSLGWLRSRRGPAGGYEATEAGMKATVYDVVVKCSPKCTMTFLEELAPTLKAMTPAHVERKIRKEAHSLFGARPGKRYMEAA